MYVFNSVDNTNLTCYSLPPTHHCFLSYLPPLYSMWNSVQMRETSIFKKLFLVRTREIPLITLRTPPPMSFAGSLALIAISYTLVNQEEDLATDSEHLPDVERNDKDASKSVARYFNLPDYSKQHMAVCSLSLHLGSLESRKTLEQKFIFQIGILHSHDIHECFSFN